MSEVRIATPNEIDAIMGAALAACEENGFVQPNPNKLADEIWQALNLHYGMVGVIGDPGKPIEAAVLLRIGAMWYSDQMVVEEKAVFIVPGYRDAKGKRMEKICQFSKSVADSLGFPLMIGVLSNHRTKAKVRLYEREFGKSAGAFFLYKAKTGEYQQAAE